MERISQSSFRATLELVSTGVEGAPLVGKTLLPEWTDDHLTSVMSARGPGGSEVVCVCLGDGHGGGLLKENVFKLIDFFGVKEQSVSRRRV